MRIAVIGAVNREKGADMLDACAQMARARHLPLQFHLIGYAHRHMHRSVISHGPYLDTELADRLGEVEPHLAWFPARWPETFSYTLSAVLNNGIPALVPDIGAFPERVKNRPCTWIYPWKCPVSTVLDRLCAIRDEFINVSNHIELSWHRSPAGNTDDNGIEDFYSGGYLVPPTGMDVLEKALDADYGRRVIQDFMDRATEKNPAEQLLTILMLLKSIPFIARLSQWIPYDIQRRIKHRLSRRPVHDLMR